MQSKKFGIVMMMVLVLALLASAVSAQPGGNGGRGGDGPGGFGQGGRGGRDGNLQEIIQIVTEQTGLTVLEIRDQLQAGSTLNDVITANGGNTQVVIDAVITAATDRINQAVLNGRLTQERADEMLATLQEAVTNFIMTGERPELGGERGGMGEIVDVVTEQTGLTAQEIREQIQAGSSLADVITANGGNVQVVIDAAVTAATERINEAVANGRLTQERADEMLANLPQMITDMVNGELPLNAMQPGNRDRARFVNSVATATGLTAAEITEQVQAGTSLATILTENGVNVETFVDEQLADMQTRLDEQVAAGRISQAVADARLALARVELIDRLNRVPQAPATDANS
jgi:uncharacterized protein (DUF2267 family)